MAIAIVKLIALATLAVLGASWGPQSASALSVESHNFVRHENAARHGMIAKRQTAAPNRKRCKARTSSLTLSSSSSTSQSSSRPAPSSTRAQGAPTTTPPAQSTPKPTTSKAPAPSPTPNNNNGGGGQGKVGIAYARNVNVPKFVSGSRKVSKVYNWSPYKDAAMMGQIPWVDFVPMFWGQKQAADLQRNVKAGYAKHILGMNEPNQDGQANIDPHYGAQLWKQYIQPLASQGYTLVSPAPTNAPSGLQWLRDFLGACDGCTVHAIATHFYGVDAEAFVGHLETYQSAFGRPLWVTEYACQDFSGRNQQCSPSQVTAFMKRSVNYMDNNDGIAVYFWFGVLDDVGMNNVNRANQLINPDGSPNALGRKYLGLESF